MTLEPLNTSAKVILIVSKRSPYYMGA